MRREIVVADKHRLTKEGDDVVTNAFGGSPDVPEMIKIVDAIIELADGKPIFFMLDMTKLETVPAAVRKVIGDSSTRINFKAIGMFGATFHIRVVASLINSALSLFGKAPFPQQFFDSREQVMTWFDKLRAEALAKVG